MYKKLKLNKFNYVYTECIFFTKVLQDSDKIVWKGAQVLEMQEFKLTCQRFALVLFKPCNTCAIS